MPWPNNTPTLDDLPDLSPQESAGLPVELLAVLQHETEEALKRARAAKARLDAALALRYADRAAEARRAAGMGRSAKKSVRGIDFPTYGTVRLEDGDFTAIADLPERVDWDQQTLAAMVEHIRAAGDDPAQYVDIAIRVPERKYTAWPDNIREQFEPARTVRPGTLTVEIVPREVDQ